MSFLEESQKIWRAMSVSDRQSLLQKLAKSAGRQDIMWGDKSADGLANISNFDNLPGDLAGRLMMCVKDGMFSVEEQERAQDIVNEARDSGSAQNAVDETGDHLPMR